MLFQTSSTKHFLWLTPNGSPERLEGVSKSNSNIPQIQRRDRSCILSVFTVRSYAPADPPTVPSTSRHREKPQLKRRSSSSHRFV
ncbi:hypothetical protein ZHAS_00018696 [Anopheles sinensis]|uniref:Uncharacterized protein n=1 Tax=Anopheles sinensis TaxID=74873 RepID=A0A084WKB7_ANOSI|nr:hypothetical protein ZHAS_00018696 [Anopheles sinensis]